MVARAETREMETTVGRVSILEDGKELCIGPTIEWTHLLLSTPHQDLLGSWQIVYCAYFSTSKHFERTDCRWSSCLMCVRCETRNPSRTTPLLVFICKTEIIKSPHEHTVRVCWVRWCTRMHRLSVSHWARKGLQLRSAFGICLCGRVSRWCWFWRPEGSRRAAEAWRHGGVLESLKSPGVAGGKVQPNCSPDHSTLKIAPDDYQRCHSCGVGLAWAYRHAVSVMASSWGSGRWRLMLKFILLGFGLLWFESNWVLVLASWSHKVCNLFLITRNPNVEIWNIKDIFRCFKDIELFKCLNFLKTMGLEKVGMFLIVILILICYLGDEQGRVMA